MSGTTQQPKPACCPCCGSVLAATPPNEAMIVGRVVALASETFGVPREDVLRRSRRQPGCFVRQVCMWLLRETAGFSHHTAAVAFGYDDRGTATCAVARVRDACDAEPETRARVDYLQAQVKALLSPTSFSSLPPVQNPR